MKWQKKWKKKRRLENLSEFVFATEGFHNLPLAFIKWNSNARLISKMLDKDSNHIHMGDGSTCKELKLVSGKHIIRTLFATAVHVPYNRAITSTVIFTVK